MTSRPSVSWPWQPKGPLPSSDNLAPDRCRVHLNLLAVDCIDRPPELEQPVFVGGDNLTSIYQDDSCWQIFFASEALAKVPNQADGDTDALITLQVKRAALSASRLEDIVLSSLAPVLRLHGLFMVHAFAVERDGSALLLVGESGSGKTTSGLSLISQGWRYLANDVALITVREGSVIALPTPGGIGLDTNSLELLPDLATPPGIAHGKSTKYFYPATSLVAGWGMPAHVSKIIFPRIGRSSEATLRPVSRAVALARLMEASVDRWDTASLKEHIDLLALLSGQAEGYDLQVGRNLQRLPSLVSQTCWHDPEVASR
jgi:hypothetical protein